MPVTHRFVKRDEEYLLPKPVIVLLIMFASMVVTMLGYATHRLWGFGEDHNGVRSISVGQQEYMAAVRVRNLQAMESESRKARYDQNRR